ncbi:CDGSH iron-sulfur domain-containing protein [Kitasatospora sp. NPDC092039]|uniref:CDGSH iron-sulfur domain-containing protein n=1 Tax=Kitasatospora sp. NPDC092039 TaxID=3364086 RepID=UPI0037F31C1A
MSSNADRGATRVVVVPNGPLLVEGPVEVVLPDGTVRLSERPVVALCACRRSRTYPFCDTSHRRHSRPQRGPDGVAGQA